MESHHEQRAHWACQEGHPGLTLLSSRSLFLAAAASSCSAESCFSFSSSWRFRTATGSPFCVACQHGVAHQWGHHLQTHPLHPTHTTSCPLFQGKIQLPKALRASLPENGVPSLPLHLLRLGRALPCARCPG